MEQLYKEAIALEFKQCIEETVDSLVSKSKRKRDFMDPFRQAVISPEGIFWARFETNFKVHFDKDRIARIARQVALANGASTAETQKHTVIKLAKGEIQNVARHFSLLTSKSLKRKPEWSKDLNSVQVYQPVRDVEVSITSDLWFEKEGKQHFFRLCPGKPTQMQAIYAKADMLHLKLANPEHEAYMALYFNPFTERQKYRHQPPREIFDMKEDDTVLIGEHFWNTIGGENTFETILQIAAETSEQERERLNELAAELKY